MAKGMVPELARAGTIKGVGDQLANVDDGGAKYIRMKIRDLVAANTQSAEEPVADMDNANRPKARRSPVVSFHGRGSTPDPASGSGSDRSQDGQS